MAAVQAAGFAGTLAAHALPSQTASIGKYFPRIPAAVPKIYANWAAGTERAKLIVKRQEQLGPKGAPERTFWNQRTRGDKDLWVDEGLPKVMSREEYLSHLQWRKDLYATGQFIAPSLVFGPIGLLQVVRQLRCVHELPSPFYQDANDLVEARLMRDQLRLNHGAALRGRLALLLAHNAMSNTNADTVTYHEEDLAEITELFDFDGHTLRNMDLFDKYVPIIQARHAEAWRVDAPTTRLIGLFFGFPVSTLGGGGRLKNYLSHFQALRQDDVFIRAAGGVAKMDDKALFEAAFERGLVRQEESEITRPEIERRLDVWLKLGDPTYWAGKLPKTDAHADATMVANPVEKHDDHHHDHVEVYNGHHLDYSNTVPSPLFQVLLAANVYCDAPYDPKLDEFVVNKLRATEGVTEESVKSDLKGAYDKYFSTLTGTLESEAQAAYDAKELVRAEKEQASQKKLDDMITTLQRVASPPEASAEVVESVAVSDSAASTKKEVPRMTKRMARAWLTRPVPKVLSAEEHIQLDRETRWHNRLREVNPIEAAKDPIYDTNTFVAERNLLVSAAEKDEATKAQLKVIDEKLPDAK